MNGMTCILYTRNDLYTVHYISTYVDVSPPITVLACDAKQFLHLGRRTEAARRTRASASGSRQMCVNVVLPMRAANVCVVSGANLRGLACGIESKGSLACAPLAGQSIFPPWRGQEASSIYAAAPVEVVRVATFHSGM